MIWLPSLYFTPMTSPNATIRIGDLKIGNDLPLVFLAGPCAMESREHALETAEHLKGVFAKAGAGFIYKTSFDKANRSSLAGKRGAGLGYAGPVFEEIRGKLGIPVITDVHLPDQCADVAAVVDVLQIPAYLCRQTDLLIAAAETGKAINVKKGQFLSPHDMKNVLAKVTGSGNPNVMACERGVSFGYNTLVSDMRALPIMKSFGSPVVFDATHSVQQPGGKGDSSGGERQFVPVLARAAVSIGVAAVFIETHPDPEKAPSDGPNMVPFAELPALIESLMAFDRLAKADPV
ncbi:MAG: 2-dehydro-3-deoxyphosphooctonate aldolase (KDO 8-P synthase) [Caulobacteraceae bacterium]|nr:MAG: 2-dehydro-3-deoxyphosphooctonate aldolase (KDO 8-P synthase) [Caulobacteraceae bacterium]